MCRCILYLHTRFISNIKFRRKVFKLSWCWVVNVKFGVGWAIMSNFQELIEWSWIACNMFYISQENIHTFCVLWNLCHLHFDYWIWILWKVFGDLIIFMIYYDLPNEILKLHKKFGFRYVFLHTHSLLKKKNSSRWLFMKAFSTF